MKSSKTAILNKVMHDTFKKGQLAHLEVEKQALMRGWITCYPTVECRFDMVIISPENKMYRAQVKYMDRTFPKTQGSLFLDLRKDTRNNGKRRPYTKSEIDVILAYVPRINKVIWLGPEIFDCVESLTFRIVPASPSYNGCSRMVQDFVW